MNMAVCGVIKASVLIVESKELNAVVVGNGIPRFVIALNITVVVSKPYVKTALTTRSSLFINVNRKI